MTTGAAILAICVALLAMCVRFFARIGRRYYAAHPEEAAEAKRRREKVLAEQAGKSKGLTSELLINLPIGIAFIIAGQVYRHFKRAIPYSKAELEFSSIALALALAMFVIGLRKWRQSKS